MNMFTTENGELAYIAQVITSDKKLHLLQNITFLTELLKSKQLRKENMIGMKYARL